MAKATKSESGKKGRGCLKGCLVLVALIIAFFIGIELFRRYFIVTRIDKNAFKSYELTSEVKDIAEKITLTSEATGFFYKAEPRIVEADEFVKFCKTEMRGIEALACKTIKPYSGPFGSQTIFLLAIDDPRFADHKYAAAAHELLHLEYGRLSKDEKTRIDALLNQELTKHKDDARLSGILEEMKRVGKTEKEIIDELHSKFGVEYAQISPELEEYYKKYFLNRQLVINWYIKGGFVSRVRRIDELNWELKALSNQLTSESQVARYNAKVIEINRVYNEVQEFYKLFHPDYKPPEEKK